MLPGFFTEKVEGWFRMIDMKRTGSITKVEFRFVLQEHVEFQSLLCDICRISWDEKARCAYIRRNASGPLGLSVEERATVISDERKRTAVICDRFDWSADRKLTCKDFVAFFRNNGMLLE